MSSKKTTKVVEQSKVKAHGDDKIGESRGKLFESDNYWSSVYYQASQIWINWISSHNFNWINIGFLEQIRRETT